MAFAHAIIELQIGLVVVAAGLGLVLGSLTRRWTIGVAVALFGCGIIGYAVIISLPYAADR